MHWLYRGESYGTELEFIVLRNDQNRIKETIKKETCFVCIVLVL